MRSIQNFIGRFVITPLICLSAVAQGSDGRTKHFDKDGVSFDYPVGWSVTDRSARQAQRLIVTREGSSVQIMIIAQRDLTPDDRLEAAERDITAPLVNEVALEFGGKGRVLTRTPASIEVGETKAEGVRLSISSNKRTSTAEVYSLRQGLRFINLIYLRADADEDQGMSVWKTIRATLKVDAPVILGSAGPQAPSSKTLKRVISGGILNGKALELPRPDYPAIARAARASGVVTVQVTIDEQGRVISARAVSGHPLLQATCVQAARLAKFTPTRLEGQPVKVTGVITYNFVAQ